MSNSLQPYGLQHARLFCPSPFCPSPSPRACANSCPLSRWCHPTISSSVFPFSSFLQSFPAPKYQGLFQWVSSLHQMVKGLEIQILSISPSNECLELIYFRIDWFYLLAVQGTLKSLLQHHSSRASILQCSAFFIVQLLHSYMTTGKTIALTIWTFAGKVMSLLFNMLFMLVIAFLQGVSLF